MLEGEFRCRIAFHLYRAMEREGIKFEHDFEFILSDAVMDALRGIEEAENNSVRALKYISSKDGVHDLKVTISRLQTAIESLEGLPKKIPIKPSVKSSWFRRTWNEICRRAFNCYGDYVSGMDQ